MTNTRNEPILLLVGTETLQCAAVESLLRLWALANGLMVQALTPDECISGAALPESIRLVVFSAGPTSIQTPETQARLERIREATPGAALVILSDDDVQSEIVAAFRQGARGYISMSTNPCVALQALSFIHAGGSFVPPAVLDEVPNTAIRPEDGNPGTPDKSTYPSFGAASANGHHAAHPVGDAGNGGCGMDARGHLSALTERQLEVLDHLCMGASNKVIGRKLGMAEATVKVHVRQIMHKLGASNRTQVALRALEKDFAATEKTEAALPHHGPASACGGEWLGSIHAIRASMQAVRLSPGVDVPNPTPCQTATFQPIRR